ncbi:MAG: hypothetical protein HKM93_03345 [Desulfobacteraceae bacterium]|nr:hypothetical protein [Desulfobacteraceae bacterium]
MEWVRAHSADPAAIVFSPPLVGGNAVQQIKLFRPLVRSGYDLISYTYTGHRKVSGRFCLSGTLDTTREILDQARTAATTAGLNLYGLGCCYGAIPLLYNAARMPAAFHKLILINPIVRLNLAESAGSFLAYYRRLVHQYRILPGLRRALASYLEFLFPHVPRRRGAFGELQLNRLNVQRIFFDIMAFNPLMKGLAVEPPVLCLYGRKDRILHLLSTRTRSRYENDIRSICPLVTYYPVDGDHLLSTAGVRRKALNQLVHFLEA